VIRGKVVRGKVVWGTDIVPSRNITISWKTLDDNICFLGKRQFLASIGETRQKIEVLVKLIPAPDRIAGRVTS
jgi:hypothetical protein